MNRARLEEQFSRLLEESGDRVWTLCLRVLGNETLARDAFQDCLLNAWRALPGFRGDAQAGTWLWRIAVRSCGQILRREKRHLHDELHFEGEELYSARLPAPDDQAEGCDMERFLLGVLTPHQRAIVHLRYTQELSYEEIAQSLELSLSSVKVGLHRAKAAMRKHYERHHHRATGEKSE